MAFGNAGIPSHNPLTPVELGAVYKINTATTRCMVDGDP